MQSLRYIIKKYTLFGVNISFLALYLILLTHSRIAHDDFYFLANLKGKSVIDATINEYQTISARFTAVFLCYTLLKFFGIYKSMLVLGIFNLLLFHFAFLRLLGSLEHVKIFNTKSNFQKHNLAFFFVLVVFYSTISIQENWFWLCASCIFTTSLGFFILGVASIFHKKQNIWNYTIIIVSFAFLGGASGPLALFALLSLVLMYIFARKQRLVNNKILKVNLLISSLVLLTCFIILYLGPGNRLRESYFEEISVFQAVLLNFKITGMIFLLRLPFKIPLIVLFSIVASHFFIRKKEALTIKGFLRKFIFTSLMFVLTIFIYQLSITYKTHDIAAYRALLIVSVASLIYGFYISYWFVQLEFAQKIRYKSISFIALFGVLAFNVYNIQNQYPLVAEYSKAYNQRIEYLEDKRACSDTLIEVSPLPASGMLFSAEISRDSSHFTNQHLRMGLGIEPQIRVKDKQ